MIKINKLFSNLLLLIITVGLFSCSQLRYTNYGEPLDFLKARRIAVSNNSQIKSNKIQIAETKVNAKSINKEEHVENVICNLVAEQSNVIKDIDLKQDIVSVKSNNYINNIDKKQILKSASKIGILANMSNTANVEQLNNKLSLDTNTVNDLSDEELLILILCFFLPPLAVFLIYGVDEKLIISLILSCLFWIPGVIYALIVCF